MESRFECGRHFNRCRDWTATAENPGEGAIFPESSVAATALHRTRQVYRYMKKTPFLRLLGMIDYTASSRPRDKIFSLLNLAAESYLSEEDFNPDYVSPDETVMARYARRFVRNGAVLELLYHAGHSKSASFYSWIPDFMGLRHSRGARQRTYPPTISTWKTRGRGGFYAGPRRMSLQGTPRSIAASRPAPVLPPGAASSMRSATAPSWV